MSFTTDAARWRALTTRDPAANNQFVYTVKSTNIYCRPTCPARLARRANIGFCATAAEAEAAGFRACKRCKPDEAIQEDPQERAVAKACTLIEEAVKADDSKAFRLQDLAKNVGLTPRYFHKIFKDKTGLTPKEYAKACMGEIKPEAADAGVGLAGDDAPTNSESFDAEGFNFNDLVDFNFDPDMLDMTSSDAAQTQLIQPQPQLLDPTLATSAMFGEVLDVNIQTVPIWDLSYESNIPELGFASECGKLGGLFDAGSTSSESSESPISTPLDSLGWEPASSVTPAVSTFELDAALLMSGAVLPEGLTEFSWDYAKAF